MKHEQSNALVPLIVLFVVCLLIALVSNIQAKHTAELAKPNVGEAQTTIIIYRYATLVIDSDGTITDIYLDSDVYDCQDNITTSDEGHNCYYWYGNPDFGKALDLINWHG